LLLDAGNPGNLAGTKQNCAANITKSKHQFIYQTNPSKKESQV
jgi:hypothetical protein